MEEIKLTCDDPRAKPVTVKHDPDKNLVAFTVNGHVLPWLACDEVSSLYGAINALANASAASGPRGEQADPAVQPE